MGHGHSHGGSIPSGSAAGRNKSRLAWALALTLTYMAAEVVGGLLTGSLALLADAAHMVTDAGGLALSLLAIHYAAKEIDDTAFGYSTLSFAGGLIFLGMFFDAIDGTREDPRVLAPQRFLSARF
mgnify:CR=1 FL=1